jgi:hypothetical protein
MGLQIAIIVGLILSKKLNFLKKCRQLGFFIPKT